MALDSFCLNINSTLIEKRPCLTCSAVKFSAPQNPCDPNPCGMHALCESDNGNPICYCPKGMTGNPFKSCSKFHDYAISWSF